MTTEQKIRLTMYLSVINCGNLNEAAVNSISKFAISAANLQNTVKEIQLIGEMQGVNKTGLAIDKNKLKKKLIALALKNSNKVAILAKLSNNDTLLNEVRYTETDLNKLPGVTLKEQSQIIYDRVEANIANLAEQGVTAETQKAFLETITAFNNAISSPRTGITEKSKATKKLALLFAAADDAIEIMDMAAASAKDEYPDFYNGYKASRKLIDTNAGNIALKGTATDITNGATLKGVIFTFKGSNGNGEIIKKTAEKGSFHIKNIQSGNYKVAVRKSGYKDKEVTVSIIEGERSELKVEMEKV
ncbi:MAG: carboxypeptidase-like regulatory domain-containing protein [Bacteroidales bacterium]|nr:carboxypeptidase-like regulatory domain-containing protein [Bacteroidales bacterium]